MRTRNMMDLPRNEAGLVDKYIGTAYDNVLLIAQNMDILKDMGTRLDNLPIDTQNIVRTTLDDMVENAQREIAEYTELQKNSIDTHVDGKIVDLLKDVETSRAKIEADNAELANDLLRLSHELDHNRQRIKSFENEIQSVYNEAVLRMADINRNISEQRLMIDRLIKQYKVDLQTFYDATYKDLDEIAKSYLAKLENYYNDTDQKIEQGIKDLVEQIEAGKEAVAESIIEIKAEMEHARREMAKYGIELDMKYNNITLTVNHAFTTLKALIADGVDTFLKMETAIIEHFERKYWQLIADLTAHYEELHTNLTSHYDELIIRIDNNAEDATNAFDKNAQGKTDEFNENVEEANKTIDGKVGEASSQADRAKDEADRAKESADESKHWAVKAKENSGMVTTAFVGKSDLVDSLGNSITKVLHQKAITNFLENKRDKDDNSYDSIYIGDYTLTKEGEELHILVGGEVIKFPTKSGELLLDVDFSASIDSVLDRLKSLEDTKQDNLEFKGEGNVLRESIIDTEEISLSDNIPTSKLVKSALENHITQADDKFMLKTLGATKQELATKVDESKITKTLGQTEEFIPTENAVYKAIREYKDPSKVNTTDIANEFGTSKTKVSSQYLTQLLGNQISELNSTVVEVNETRLEKSKNLSDLIDVETARTNLGLGSSATLNKTDVLGTSTDLVATQKLVNDTKTNLENSVNTTNQALRQAVPVGFVASWIGETAPNSDWLIMRGQKYDRAKYSELYDLLKTDTLPDGRGVMLRGLDANRGFDPGRSLLSYQEDAMQKITGGINSILRSEKGLGTLDRGAFSMHGIGIEFNLEVQQYGFVSRGTAFDSSHVTRTNNQNETVSKNIAVNIIIKVK